MSSQDAVNSTELEQGESIVSEISVPKAMDNSRDHRIKKMTDEELNEPEEEDYQSFEGDDSKEADAEAEADVTQATVGTVGTMGTLAPPLPPARESKIRKWFKFGGNDTTEQSMSSLGGKENYNFALSRYKENNEALQAQTEKDQEAVNTCADNLRKTFNEIKTGIEYSQDELLIKGIDWEFWSKVVNDYSAVVENDPVELLDQVSKGIPKELRGMVWQLICNSKSLQLEDFYRVSKNGQSDYEKLIKRDLARTSFVTTSEVCNKMDELFDIIKCYSLYDREVGYTQGMAFLTVPLLMNMDAGEAFCMLVKLMTNYEFRTLYIPDMTGLHLKLYQFDRLIEDRLPELYGHLQAEGVRSSMYATQWFLTLFGYKFPLEMVLRIYDMVIAEGIDTLLRFALNLMDKNAEYMMKLPFDQLVTFLNDKVFYYYLGKSTDDITTETYHLDDMVKDSMSVTILPLEVHRYEAEYQEIQRLYQRRTSEIERISHENSELLGKIRKIEADYATLNKKHVDIANEMVEGKVTIANLREENKQLNKQLSEADQRLSNLEKQKDTKVDFTGEISTILDREIQTTMERNATVMTENADLEDKLAQLEQEKAALVASSKKRGWKSKLW